MPDNPAESTGNRVKESAACDVCGRFGAVEFGNWLLCEDCYCGCGSCCDESVLDSSTCRSRRPESGAPRLVLDGRVFFT